MKGRDKFHGLLILASFHKIVQRQIEVKWDI